MIEVYHSNLKTAMDDYTLIRDKLSGFSGAAGSHTIGRCFVRSESESWMGDDRHYKVFGQFELGWTV